MSLKSLVSYLLSISLTLASFSASAMPRWNFFKNAEATQEPKVCFDILTRNERVIIINTKLTADEIKFAHTQAKKIYQEFEDEKKDRVIGRTQWNFVKTKITKGNRWFNGLRYYAYFSTKGIPQKIRRVIRGNGTGSADEYVKEKVIGEAEAYPMKKLNKITEGILNLLYLRKIKKFLNENSGSVTKKVAILTEYPYVDSETGQIAYHKRTFAGLGDFTKDIRVMGISNPDIKVDSRQFRNYLNRKYLDGLHTTQAYLIGVLRILQNELRILDEARAKPELRELLDRVTTVVGEFDDQDAFDKLGDVFNKVHGSEDFAAEVQAMMEDFGLEEAKSTGKRSKYHPPIEYVYEHKSRVWFAEFLYAHGIGGGDEMEDENRKLRDSNHSDTVDLGVTGEKHSITKKGMAWMVSLLLTATLANYIVPVADSMVKYSGQMMTESFPTAYVRTIDALEWVGIKDSMYLYEQKEFLLEANKRILTKYDISKDISFENWSPQAQRDFISLLGTYENTENADRRNQVLEKNLGEYSEKYSKVHAMIEVVAVDELNWEKINKYLRSQKVFLAEGQLESLKKSFDSGEDLTMIFLGGPARQIISEMHSVRKKYIELRKNDQNNLDQVHAELHFIFTVNDIPYYNSAL